LSQGKPRKGRRGGLTLGIWILEGGGLGKSAEKKLEELEALSVLGKHADEVGGGFKKNL